MATRERHSIVKEFIHDGIVLDGMHCSPEMLDSVKKFTFKEDDVLVATYSKSGRSA